MSTKPGADDVARRVELARAVEPLADLGDHAVGDRDVGRRRGAPVPSTSVPPRITTSAVTGDLLGRCRACRAASVSHAVGDVDARVRFGRPFRMAERRPSPNLPHDAGRRVHGPAGRRGRGAAARRALGPDDVLLEVSHCGICGSDLHFLLEWGGHDGRDRRPRVQRHRSWRSATRSTAGRSATGSSADRAPSADAASTASRTGRRCASSAVGSAPTRATGRARSPRYKAIPASQLLRIPDDLASKHAALAEPMAVALHGITRGGGARPGTRWLVTGGGPIGFLSVAALKAAGRRRHRRERAARTRGARCANGSVRAPCIPTSSTAAGDAARHGRRAVRRRARVFGQQQGDGVRARAAQARGHARARRRGHPRARSSTTTASCSTSS